MLLSVNGGIRGLISGKAVLKDAVSKQPTVVFGVSQVETRLVPMLSRYLDDLSTEIWLNSGSIFSPAWRLKYQSVPSLDVYPMRWVRRMERDRLELRKGQFLCFHAQKRRSTAPVVTWLSLLKCLEVWVMLKLVAKCFFEGEMVERRL